MSEQINTIKTIDKKAIETAIPDIVEKIPSKLTSTEWLRENFWPGLIKKIINAPNEEEARNSFYKLANNKHVQEKLQLKNQPQEEVLQKIREEIAALQEIAGDNSFSQKERDEAEKEIQTLSEKLDSGAVPLPDDLQAVEDELITQRDIIRNNTDVASPPSDTIDGSAPLPDSEPDSSRQGNNNNTELPKKRLRISENYVPYQKGTNMEEPLETEGVSHFTASEENIPDDYERKLKEDFNKSKDKFSRRESLGDMLNTLSKSSPIFNETYKGPVVKLGGEEYLVLENKKEGALLQSTKDNEIILKVPHEKIQKILDEARIRNQNNTSSLEKEARQDLKTSIENLTKTKGVETPDAVPGKSHNHHEKSGTEQNQPAEINGENKDETPKSSEPDFTRVKTRNLRRGMIIAPGTDTYDILHDALDYKAEKAGANYGASEYRIAWEKEITDDDGNPRTLYKISAGDQEIPISNTEIETYTIREVSFNDIHLHVNELVPPNIVAIINQHGHRKFSPKDNWELVRVEEYDDVTLLLMRSEDDTLHRIDTNTMQDMLRKKNKPAKPNRTPVPIRRRKETRDKPPATEKPAPSDDADWLDSLGSESTENDDKNGQNDADWLDSL